MLKATFRTLSAFALLLLPGCDALREDRSECPETVVFDFALLGGGRFSERIASVDVGIFDGRGNYLRTERADKDDLARSQGMTIALAPGDYRLVFWANMNGGTKIDDRGAGDAWRVVHSDAMFDADRQHVTGQTDPLWFAPGEPATLRGSGAPGYFPLSVTGRKGQRESVVFAHAHRSLEIYVEQAGGLPTIEVEGAPGGLHYSGLDSPAAGGVTHRQPTTRVEREGKSYAVASFRTFRFDEPDGMNIVLTDDGGGEIFHVSLADAIAGSGSDPGGMEIVLVLRFIKGNVDVTIPEWGRDKVDVN